MRATRFPRRSPPPACGFLARSFKYHRPRGILSFANHDSNTLFQVDGVPNVRGDVTLLRDGMRVSALNTFGGLERDKARILDRLRASPAGGLLLQGISFQTTVPALGTHVPRADGLGGGESRAPHAKRRPSAMDSATSGDRRGPERLSAALAAARHGARVALVDESLQGRGQRRTAGAGPLRAQFARRSPLFPATVAAGYYADHWVALARPEHMTKMRAAAVVFATGVIEQPAVFRNNDLPGVMLASGALRLLARHGIAPGRRVAVVAANLEAIRAASNCRRAASGSRPSSICVRRRKAVRPEPPACALGIPVLQAIRAI